MTLLGTRRDIVGVIAGRDTVGERSRGKVVATEIALLGNIVIAGRDTVGERSSGKVVGIENTLLGNTVIAGRDTVGERSSGKVVGIEITLLGNTVIAGRDTVGERSSGKVVGIEITLLGNAVSVGKDIVGGEVKSEVGMATVDTHVGPTHPLEQRPPMQGKIVGGTAIRELIAGLMVGIELKGVNNWIVVGIVDVMQTRPEQEVEDTAVKSDVTIGVSIELPIEVSGEQSRPEHGAVVNAELMGILLGTVAVPGKLLWIPVNVLLEGQPAPKHNVVQSPVEHEIERDEVWLTDSVGVVRTPPDEMVEAHPAPTHTLAHSSAEHEAEIELKAAGDVWPLTDVKEVVKRLEVVLGGQFVPAQTLTHSKPEHDADEL
ncbi:MAG: hypothetical protein Q9196_003982 [Gyalolechia fulgens]